MKKKLMVFGFLILICILGVVLYKRKDTPDVIADLKAEDIASIQMNRGDSEYVLSEKEDISKFLAIVQDMKLSKKIFPDQKDGIYLSIDIHIKDQDPVYMAIRHPDVVSVEDRDYASAKDYCEIFSSFLEEWN
ncbi:hypothetical protein [Sellimonas caecigallum]|uniref:Uncharacterized protein n=1 Tax=Sellimonas caecigallum TaxID=2592333 RepID=A0ABS7L5B2_9FIRM|nr:hypothetical protein [Sellimonas caecigallum]MBY0758214.1 hypothetical protein [Sellimonas caecigallum]